MDDLISRQVAIDAILTEVDEIDMPNVESRWWNMGMMRASKILEHLPSAQPDTDSRIEKAIRVLQKNYNLALSRDYIRNPIAWALYETWKEFDR